MTRAEQPRIYAAAAFILVALIWGSTWLVIKDQISVVPAGWSITWRFAGATVGMFALAMARRERLQQLVAVEQAALRIHQLESVCIATVESGMMTKDLAILVIPNNRKNRNGRTKGSKVQCHIACAADTVFLPVYSNHRHRGFRSTFQPRPPKCLANSHF